jgi:hypothetical protein
VNGLQLPRLERPLRIVAFRRLDADGAAAGRQRFSSEGRARQQSAAAAGRQQQVERPGFVEQLQGRGAGAGDDLRVVERRDDREAPLGGQAPADRLPASSRAAAWMSAKVGSGMKLC